MYLDTDIVLALIKEEDWLKKHINVKELVNPITSVLTIIETELVLNREYTRNDALNALNKIKKLNIKAIDLTLAIIEKSQKLLSNYPTLNIFDSVHAASALHSKETLVSTDTIYESIEGLTLLNPRKR